jgi:hypothetical protein
MIRLAPTKRKELLKNPQTTTLHSTLATGFNHLAERLPVHSIQINGVILLNIRGNSGADYILVVKVVVPTNEQQKFTVVINYAPCVVEMR